MNKNKLFIFLLSLFFILSTSLYSQTNLPLSHKGKITDIEASKGYFYTAAIDGFIIRWDSILNQERLQVSDIEIQKIVVHPDGNLIAVYETDGLSLFRLSVWDWQKKERLYAKRLQEKILNLSFSQQGNYLLIGNGNYDGMLILDAIYGLQMQILQNTIAQVSFAETSATESTLVSYSQNGQFIYSSLDDGSRKTTIQTETKLEKGSFLDLNKRFFAGVKNKQLYIIDATNGKVLNKISVNNPILLSSFSNTESYFIEEKSQNNYVLKKLQLEKGENRFKIISELNFEIENSISSAILNSIENLLVGTNDGSLFSVNIQENDTFIIAKKETESSQLAFLDITKDKNDFYILTNEALYKIGENEKNLEKICDNEKWKNVLAYNDNLYFYSKGEKENFVQFEKETGTFIEIFKPSLALEIVKIYDSEIIALLSSTIVQSYKFETGKIETVYSGTGLNDFILKNGNLFISKSAATNPRTALIEINSQTKETVILPLSNDFIYALDQDLNADNANIYGLSITSNNNAFTTELFNYHKDHKTYTSLLRLQDENINAFLTIQNEILYTNLGKTDIRMIDLKTNRTQVLPKTKALPKKILAIGKKTLVLNQDGTITWYQSNKAFKEWNANIPENLSL